MKEWSYMLVTQWVGLPILLGLVNWIVTVIVTQGAILEELRNKVKTFGSRLEVDSPHKITKLVGGKLNYFVACPLCVGTWIGFAEAASFGGPLHPHPAWAAWIASGLLYKAIGHLSLQVSANLHNRAEYLKAQTEVQMQIIKLRAAEQAFFAEEQAANEPTSR